MTMEYRTKWSHTHESKVPSLAKQSPITGGRQREQQLPTQTTRYSGVEPYGQLAVKELVSHVKQVRMQSPFADDYKENDPVEATPLNASDSDGNDSCSSNESLNSDMDDSVIHTQPTISNKKLSTSVFKNLPLSKKPSKDKAWGRKVMGKSTVSVKVMHVIRPHLLDS